MCMAYRAITFHESRLLTVRNWHFVRKKSANRMKCKEHTWESVCTVNKHIANWHLVPFVKSVGVAAGKGGKWRWMRRGGGWWGFRGNRVGNKGGVDSSRGIEEYKVVYSTGIRFLDLRGKETRTDTVRMLKRNLPSCQQRGVKLAIRGMCDPWRDCGRVSSIFPKTYPLDYPSLALTIERKLWWMMRPKHFAF